MHESSSPTLLVVDDDPAILALVELFARDLGFTVVPHSSGRPALATLSATRPDVAVVDIRMPDISGIDVLREIRSADPECRVILMTGDVSVDSAIEAMKRGALDYLAKPLDLDRLRELLVTVRKGVERREAMLRIDGDVAKQFEFHGMVGRSPEMQELFDSVRRVAPHVRTVLIMGETGTGKELVASALHRLGSRRERRLNTLNCSTIVESLSESELFGHMRGAFTGAAETKVGFFEHADRGTLFLDEIGELPLSLQAKLLRAVELGEVQRVGASESRRVDVHVIAATNRDLQAECAAGRFRSDLYYRLSIIELRLPPLRERREDIPYLTAAFVHEFAGRMKRPITGMTPAAERLLQHAPWPGNIRELRNVIERACILSEGRILSERDVGSAMSLSATAGPVVAAPRAPACASGASAINPNLLTTAQRGQIERVLQQSGGNKTAAAQELGVSRRALYRLIERLDIHA